MKKIYLMLIGVVFLFSCDPNSQSMVAAGEVKTIAGDFASGYLDGDAMEAQFSQLVGLAIDGKKLYIADAYTIRFLDLGSMEVSTLAGYGGSTGHLDGVGNESRLAEVNQLSLIGDSLYFCDFSNTLRSVSVSTSTVLTHCGTYGLEDVLDGSFSEALFENGPRSMCAASGSLYVGDNYVIRKADLDSQAVSTVAGVAGGGSLDGLGVLAGLEGPVALTYDGDHFIYFMDYYRIRRLNLLDFAVVTLFDPDTADPINHAANLYIRTEQMVCYEGDLYIADYRNHVIVKFNLTTGTLITIAGMPGVSGLRDGFGSMARFNGPMGMALDGDMLYISDTGNHRIRQMKLQ